MARKESLTQKQVLFAENVASGNSLADAYRMSYRADGMKDANIRTEASKLSKNPHVASMIKSIQAKRQEVIGLKGTALIDQVMERLDKLSKDAMPADSVRLSATVWLGKTAGMFKDVTETVVNKSSAEIRTELEQMLMMLDDDADGETLQ